MRVVKKPEFNALDAFQTCIGSIESDELRDRLSELVPQVVQNEIDYEHKASTEALYTIQANLCDNNDIAEGRVTKGELKKVYTAQMVPLKKPGRVIYDKILSNAPLGKCPFCGIGSASTLDHYLPKSKFPILSVLPLNLVPSCSDCNGGKNASVASTKEEQGLHPYFDHNHYIDDQWLFAEVIQSAPATIRFYVSPPSGWSDVSTARIRAHFKDYKLASRYANESPSELAELRLTLSEFLDGAGLEQVKSHLRTQANINFCLNKNSWKTAMYQALSESDWYCSVGFR